MPSDGNKGVGLKERSSSGRRLESRSKERPVSDRSTNSPELSVVVPVWNGDHSLGKLLPRLFAALHAAVPGLTEVLVVLPPDDPVGSLVERAGARVVRFDRPGYGHALNAGLAA